MHNREVVYIIIHPRYGLADFDKIVYWDGGWGQQ
jgi:hypothetical protein